MLPNTAIANVRGCQFIVFDKPDIITNGLRYGGGHESQLEEISAKLIGEFKDGIVLDIGANLGSYVIPIAKKFHYLQFYSFEPQRIIYYQLCGNLIINALDNVHTINCALSDQDAIIETAIPNYFQETNIGAFSLDPEVRHMDYECATVGGKEQMTVCRLDDYNYENVRLIKIDVEGLELNVLKGSLQTLANNGYPPIIFEAWTYKKWFQQRRTELYEFIRSLGYNITVIGENNIAQHTTRENIVF